MNAKFRSTMAVLLAVAVLMSVVPACSAMDIEALRKEALSGNAEAQCNLGVMYYNDYEVKQNYQEALKWFRLAAEQGLSNAQCNLGFMYENGEGVRQNYAEAVKWYRKAAEQGHAKAQYNLGLTYNKGLVLRRDYT